VLLNANAPNFGSMYVMLKPFEERLDPELSAEAIAGRLQQLLQEKVPNGLVNVFGAPPIDRSGNGGRFQESSSRTGATRSWKDLQKVADGIVHQGNNTEGLRELFTSFRADTPGLFLDIDRSQCEGARRADQRDFQTRSR